MSKKRRRDTATVDTQLVEIYEDLANESEEIRLKAAGSLLSKVSSENPLSKDGLLEYLTRLIRGLCSSRKAARLGFSVALTELLVQILGRPQKEVPSQLGVEEFIDLLKNLTVAAGKVSGNEAKNYDLGRLFGAEAVIRSGILFQPNAGPQNWAQILDIILELAKKKQWLRKECGWALYKSIETLSKHKDQVQLLLDKISAYGLTKTPEGVAIWLGIRSTGTPVHFQEGVWHNNDPLHRKEKTTLAKVLREAPSTTLDQGDGINKTHQIGNWTPDLHFAWEVVVAALLGQKPTKDLKKKKKGDRLTFEDFWNEAVEDGLLATSSSNYRKAWGLLLFQRLLLSTPGESLPVIFTSKTVEYLLNQLGSSERYLHQYAEKTIHSVCRRVNQEPSVGHVVLNGLLLQEPAPSARQILKSKIIEKFLKHVGEEAVVDVLPVFSRLFAKPNAEDEKAAEASRRTLADQLVAYLKSSLANAQKTAAKSSGPKPLADRILSLFAEYAYFDCQQPLREPSISEQSREMFKSSIISCLNLILAKHAEPASFTYQLIASIRTMDEEGLGFLFQSEGDIGKTVDKAWAIAGKIHSKSASTSRRQLLNSFEVLYSVTLLQVYNGEADAVAILDELKTSYDSLLKHRQKSEQGSSDALVEILLSFASKSSSLFRRLAEGVFSACTSEIGSQGLQAMIKILETRESLAGQNELFDEENDEDEDTSDDDDDPSNASDTSIADPQPNGAPKAHTNGVFAGSSSGDGASEDGQDEELAAFDAKLAFALGTRSAADDMAASDKGDSSDEDMNDEQMEAMDEHISKIFRERKNTSSKKSQSKDAREAIVNFKSRVLDLLKIYVTQQHTNALTLDVLIPLLVTIRITRSPVVSEKASNVIREYSRLCKPKSVPPVSDVQSVIGLLREIHRHANTEGSKAYGAACSQASLLLVKSLFAQDTENFRLVATVYAETHATFVLDQKSKVRPVFITEWVNWSVSARDSLTR